MSGRPFQARHGVMVTGLVLACDQLSKWAVLEWLEPGQPLPVLPFFNLVLVWNRGVSFGLLAEVGAAAPWLLIMLTLGIAGLLVWWFGRESSGLARCALALVLGGAVGNLIDRLRYGAVVDFLDFHLAGWHWPAFNLADTAIVCGAVLLLLDNTPGFAHIFGTKRREGQ